MALLSLLLSLLVSAPENTRPRPLELLYATGQLESLPLPVLVPDLPEEFVLNDVRLQRLPHVREGQVLSYTLVFVSKDQSFMLQSRPNGYRLNDKQCTAPVLLSSKPFRITDFDAEPQTLELISPACSVTGQVLPDAAITLQQAETFWKHLHWYLPLPLRYKPAHLLLFQPELQ